MEAIPGMAARITKERSEDADLCQRRRGQRVRDPVSTVGQRILIKFSFRGAYLLLLYDKVWNTGYGWINIKCCDIGCPTEFHQNSHPQCLS